MRHWLTAFVAVFWNCNCLRSETIDFNRDVRPILSDKCFRCHGPDEGERANDLRLDSREIAFSELESGETAVVAKAPAASELVRRITSSDPDYRMPPTESGKKLAPTEIEILKRWIEQGAHWNKHWAFLVPVRPKLPDVSSAWLRNPIDAFVLAKLKENGLQPSIEATRPELIRRVTLDLTGLAPSPGEVQLFLTDHPSPLAYDRLVDRLLQSHRYGEQQARYWLDAARYGDTHGLHLDNERSIWPYRDWVIQAFNSNLPFDQFTIEQLAGDLLPNPSQDQLVATGFNRCNVTTSEGGSIDEEYLVRYAVERVETTSTVWMGLTTGCAVCHDHKFDPISQQEFYQLFAYFFSLTERAMDGNALLPPPVVKVKTRVQARLETRLESQLEQVAAELQLVRSTAKPSFERWAGQASQVKAPSRIPMDTVIYASFDEGKADVSLGKTVGKVIGKASWDAGKFQSAFRFDGNTHIENGDIGDFERIDQFSCGAWVYREDTNDGHLTVLSRMDDDGAFRGYDLYIAGGKVFVHLINLWDKNAIRVNTRRPIVRQKWQHVMMTYDGSSKAKGVKIYVDGKLQELDITHDRLSNSIRTSKPFRIGRRSKSAPFVGMIDEVRVYARELSGDDVGAIIGVDPIGAILATSAADRSADQNQSLFEHYLKTFDDPYKRLASQRARLDTQINQLRSSFPSTLIMRELKEPRQAHVLIRGQYEQKGTPVEPGVPVVLPPFTEQGRSNRLDLAKWLVDPTHPLTARVVVNRIWQQYFGTGIVKSIEDFGSQGDWPSHPRLLDWLAVELIESGWDVKHIHRLIVTSATYRQSSQRRYGAKPKDPENRLLSRGPRFRMDAEMIRDNALYLSGLLVERLGGRSVKPYQPDGLWFAVGYTASNTARFQQDHGWALYRRSLYTFWKRTSPPPSMQILDAPSREVCTVRRPRTNTPAGALLLMNDVQFVEAARHFGYRIMREGGDTVRQRIRFAYLCATSRDPDAEEVKIIEDLLTYYLAEFRGDHAAANRLVSMGESPVSKAVPIPEQAAWTMVASTILNLDEVVTKQ